MLNKLFKVFKRHAVSISLNLLVLMVLLLNASELYSIGFMDRLENFAYDVRLRLTMPGGIDPRIVIVDIDERSLREEGRWPWPRNRLATLVQKLFDDYGIDVLAFDVVFAEKDESSGLRTLEDIGQRYLKSDTQFNAAMAKVRPDLDYDQRFAQQLRGRPVALGYYFYQGGKHDGGVGTLPPPAFAQNAFTGKDIHFIHADSYGANLPELQRVAAAGGHFNTEPGEDGVSRKIALFREYGGAEYEALSLATARLALRVSKVQPVFADGVGVGQNYAGLEWVRVGRNRVPVDDHVTALIPFRGLRGSFPYISAADVLHGRVDPEMLKGTIVLVGTTAPGLMDLRVTPFDSAYPGVEVHANMIAGILDQNIKEHPAYTVAVEMVQLLLVGLLLALLLPVLTPLWATLATFLTLSGVVALNLAFWQYGNLVFPLASTLVLVLLIFTLNMSYGFFVESRGKRQLAGLFGQYVPPALVDEMAKDPKSFTLEGESREMTVLFSDVRGFTSISEKLNPQELTQLMNAFLTPMTQVIHHHRGTIDKYMGDCIMAFWGAPLADPEHACHGLLAAMMMIERLHDLQRQFEAKGWPPIEIGVGLNTGDMVVGNMGSEFRTAYTVMGDAVNLGSRLEGLTKTYGVHIIVSEFTKAAAPDFLYRELDHVRVKGKDQPVGIFEPLCLTGQESRELCEELDLYQQARQLYRTQAWDAAEQMLIGLQQQNPACKLYALYLERIAYYRQNPPGDDWDGVFNFKTK